MTGSGLPDGMKVDTEGNVYGTGPGGIWIFDPAGTHLGMIVTGAQTTNVAWGDADWQTLYFTTWNMLGRFRTAHSGHSRCRQAASASVCSLTMQTVTAYQPTPFGRSPNNAWPAAS